MKAFLLVVWISIVGVLQVKSQPILAGEISLPSSLSLTNVLFENSDIYQEDSSSITIVFRNLVYHQSGRFDPHLYVAKISLLTNTVQWITKIDTVLVGPNLPISGWRGWTLASSITYADSLIYVGATFERLSSQGEISYEFVVTRINAQTGLIFDQKRVIPQFGALPSSGAIIGGIAVYDQTYVTFHQEYQPAFIDTAITFRLTYFYKQNNVLIDQKIVPTITLPPRGEFQRVGHTLKKTPSGIACTVFQWIPVIRETEYAIHLDSSGTNLQWVTPNPFTGGPYQIITSESGNIVGRFNAASNQIELTSHTGSNISSATLSNVIPGNLELVQLFENQTCLGLVRTSYASPTQAVLFGNNGSILWQCNLGSHVRGVKKLLDGQYLVVTANADSLKLRLYGANVSVNSIPRLHTKVYPNPSTGNVYIETEHDEVVCTIYDQTGKKVFHSLLFEKHIDLSFLPNGIYTYRVEHKETYGFGKIVLLR